MLIVKHKSVAALLSNNNTAKVTSITKGKKLVSVSHGSKPMIAEAPIFELGFPPSGSNLIAVANTFHINKYYYEAAEDQWYLVVDAKCERNISKWVMRPVNEIGRPIGDNRSTSVDLWANRFSDRPFDVHAHSNPDGFVWFKKNFVVNKDVVCQLEMYDAYLDRLRFCSSYEALVRLGLVKD